MLTLLAIGYLIATVAGDEAPAESMMGRAQMMMFGGFVMLGWVLARRTLKNRKKSRAANRTANVELAKIRSSVPSVTPLVDAPKEVQRWQGAMHDLTRELSAELEGRIATVQSLIDQIDGAANGVERLTIAPEQIQSPPMSGTALTEFVREGIALNRDVEQMASEAGVDPGEIRWTVAAMTPNGKVGVSLSS